MVKEKVLLVVSACGLSLPHIGIVNEILKTKLQNFEKKILLQCNGNLPSCYLNPIHNIIGCALCIERTKDIIQNQFNFEKIYSIDRSINKHEINFNIVNSSDDLKMVKYKEIDVGRGIMSSIVSRTREYNFDLKRFKNHINHLFSQSISIIEQLDEIVKIQGVTDVLIFNGRFYEVYPIMSYCRSKEINFYTHEKGTTFKKYQLIKNNTVHSIYYRSVEVNKIWKQYGDNASTIAKNWFKEKEEGSITSEINFVKHQVKGMLPESWDEEKMNISIFNSSEDEYKSILEWEHDLYNSQNEIIIRLCKATYHDKNIKYYLRFHPNLVGIASEQIKELESKNLDNLIIIKPDSTISTYTLMKHSDKILTFGSRTSIEGAYLGKPSILYGASYFQTLKSLYVPSDFEELVSMISSKYLEPKKGIDLLKTALFLKEKGVPITFNNVINKNLIELDGRKYIHNYIKVFYSFLKMIPDYKLWKEYFKLYKYRNLNVFSCKEL